jgi:hypothetical protein
MIKKVKTILNDKLCRVILKQITDVGASAPRFVIFIDPIGSRAGRKYNYKKIFRIKKKKSKRIKKK